MKQWKRLAALSSAIVMAAATLTYFPNDTLQNIRWEISASADETSAVTWTKTESDGLTWTLTADGTLTISGTGAMKDYNAAENLSPAYMNSDVKKVVIEDGVTSCSLPSKTQKSDTQNTKNRSDLSDLRKPERFFLCNIIF